MIKSTFIGKDMRGSWKATSLVNVGDDSLECKIVTSKIFSGEIQSRVTVGKIDGGFVSHKMYQDYSKCVSSAIVRCTEKTVKVRHAQALDIVIQSHIDDIRKQYNII